MIDVMCNELEANISKLNSNDAKFARSLIGGVRAQARMGRPVSRNQEVWIGRLIKRTKLFGERTKTAIGTMDGINGLFNRASEHLKSPSVVLKFGQGEIRLSLAGKHTRVPGSINVALRDGDGKWYGRILQDGNFEESPREPTPDGLLPLLQEFAASPEKVAADYGKLTGKCCFCRLPLTDERSTQVGYGPTCSEKWGLPWGE